MASRNSRATEDILDAQNREYQERIASKTSHLKSIALEMEGEARDHHRLLDDLDNDFDSTKGFLSNTMNRVVLMTQSGRANRKAMCYVTVGVVFGFFFLYWLIGRAASAMSSSAVEQSSSGSV